MGEAGGGRWRMAAAQGSDGRGGGPWAVGGVRNGEWLRHRLALALSRVSWSNEEMN